MTTAPIGSVGVTVYTAGATCVQCKLTEQVMDAEGIPHTVVDLTDDRNAPAREYVTNDLGYSQAPVVVVDDHEHWAGFQPARIKGLANGLSVSARGIAAARAAESQSNSPNASHLLTTPSSGISL
ncbi:glutaredoxin family protein [Microbacterium marmarense]|uniref:Glutaredoxin family protein n=1 Tax=Microbacterium marmarense TaxID=3122051 RepID=A0ABU8LQS2_9MICO